jgi:bifunctional oligoribonuclease and PAP phosphatase NrnA
MDDPSALQRVADALRGARRIASLCHENPDADTLGAALAVALIAERLGKEYEIVSTDPPAPTYSFLPRFDQIVSEPTGLADVAVVCDAATLERIGPIARTHAAWLSRTAIINIDHHVTNLGFGTANLVDATAAATCEILAALLPELGIEPDADLATALLAGIVRDTNGFVDASTSPQTLRHTANLLEAGGPLSAIYRTILEEMPYERILLWGKLLHGLGQRHNGRVVFACLTQAMLDETNTQQPDADGIAEFIAKAKGVDIALLLREVDENATRVSIRTSAAVNAADIARPFAGGGHLRRAGWTIPAPLQEAVIQVLEACDERLSDNAARNPSLAKLA